MTSPQGTLSADVSTGRATGIGGSDARYIMNGEWRKLYRQKLGLDPADNFEFNFPVQLGKFTEDFHLRWLAKKGTIDRVQPKDFYVHPQFPFLFAHLDGWCMRHDTFVEAKHSNGGADFRFMAQFYLPQIAHECLVTGRRRGLFSMIAGNDEPVCEIVEPTARYLEDYLALAKQFAWHLLERIEPDDEVLSVQQTAMFDSAAGEVPATMIGGFRDYDMSKNNEWVDVATRLCTNRKAFEDYKKDDEAIRLLVPADGATVKGAGVCFKRAKNNSIRISFI